MFSQKLYCVARNCLNKEDSTDVIIHRFPLSITTKNLWLKALGITNASLTSGSGVCSEHFRNTDFFFNSNRNRLIVNAIPTVNLRIQGTSTMSGNPEEKAFKKPVRVYSRGKSMLNYVEIESNPMRVAVHDEPTLNEINISPFDLSMDECSSFSEQSTSAEEAPQEEFNFNESINEILNIRPARAVSAKRRLRELLSSRTASRNMTILIHTVRKRDRTIKDLRQKLVRVSRVNRHLQRMVGRHINTIASLTKPQQAEEEIPME